MNAFSRPVLFALAAAILLSLASCQSYEHQTFKNGETIDHEEFPDLVSLLDEQRELLSRAKVRKTITHDGKTEMMLLDSAAWSDNMDFFYNSHISRTLLQDRYNTFAMASGDTLHYIAGSKNNNLFTEYQKFSRVNDQWVKVEVLNQRKTLLFDITQHLTFDISTPHVSVLVTRKALFADPVDTRLELEFLQ